MAANKNEKALVPVSQFKEKLYHPSVQEQFANALKDEAARDLFSASMLELYSNEKSLQGCNPSDLLREALKAAVLRLPLNKGLGFAYIIAYKGVPSLQLGYKGYTQLALRSGMYATLNAGVVYDGELLGYDKLSGRIDLTGTAKNGAKAIGYFAYLELLSGFKKSLYWTKEQVIEHAKRYSRNYNTDKSVWKSNFDGMAKKTMVTNLLSKYGLLSVELMGALAGERETPLTPEAEALEREQENANKEPLDVQEEGEAVDASYELVDDADADGKAADNNQPPIELYENEGPGF